MDNADEVSMLLVASAKKMRGEMCGRSSVGGRMKMVKLNNPYWALQYSFNSSNCWMVDETVKVGSVMSTIIKFYRVPGPSKKQILADAKATIPQLSIVETEYCFNVECIDLPDDQREKLVWLLAETFEASNLSEKSFLDGREGKIVEIGPRLQFSTAFSSNSVSMCKACGISSVTRVERSRRYLFKSSSHHLDIPIGSICDKMTETVYETPLESFENDVSRENFKIIPLLEEGKTALERLNSEMGLGFDDWDLDFYTNMFTQTLRRNPTDVECFDLGQSNSEHSRHWFFGGRMVIDGDAKDETLFSMVKATLPKESNSVIAFHDNSSVCVSLTTLSGSRSPSYMFRCAMCWSISIQISFRMSAWFCVSFRFCAGHRGLPSPSVAARKSLGPVASPTDLAGSASHSHS